MVSAPSSRDHSTSHRSYSSISLSNLCAVARKALIGVVVRNVSLLVWSGSILLAFLLFLLIIWYLARPTGNLDFHFSLPENRNNMTKQILANELFHKAYSYRDTIVRLYKTLSFDPPTDGLPFSLPTLSAPGEFKLRRIIREFRVSIDPRTKNGTFQPSLVVDILEILEATYSLFGWEDKLLIFRHIQEEKTECRLARKCLDIVVDYHPQGSITRNAEIEAISPDLMIHVLRGTLALNEENDQRHTSTDIDGSSMSHLSLAETPNTMKEFLSTAQGIDILLTGTDHPDCKDKGTNTCIEMARRALEPSEVSPSCATYPYVSFEKQRQPTLSSSQKFINPIASYALALLYLRAAILAAEKAAPELIVECYLQRTLDAASQVKSIFSSPNTLLGTLKRQGKLPVFRMLTENYQLSDPAKLFEREKFVQEIREFGCAMSAQRRGRWKECVKLAKNIERFPKELRPYIAAAEIDAMLNINGDDPLVFETVRRRLNNISKVETSKMPTRYNTMFYKIGVIFLDHACVRPEMVSNETFRKLLKKILTNVPQGQKHAWQEAIVRSMDCREDGTLERQKQFKSIKKVIKERPDTRMSMVWLQLKWHLAIYYLRRGSEYHDGALSMLIEALILPWADEKLQTSMYFEKFQQSPLFEEYQAARASVDVVDYPELCRSTFFGRSE